MMLSAILDTISPLSNKSKDAFAALVTEVSYPKDHLLFRENKVEKNIYFLKKGIARAYLLSENSEVTFWFGIEGDGLLSIKSYVFNQKSYESMELLEDCELYQISIERLKNLYSKHTELANWGRKLAELELIKAEERLISMQFKSARERYIDLIAQRPELLQRVQLGHIASYLGITQVSLSRIRADIR